ncbi:hypothetical protein GCM10011499_02040 [Pelagibacterium lentulum]|uniref:Uncharacterized protein n=1 Tax=Pelagibacterium lentulum TaxID=2029865 RepID=A0A916R625_9HYPH|nr:hypothetical protein GCM10011499_02040 [Pelagibacterium lentulum]
MLRLLGICLICVMGGGLAALSEARPFLAAQGSEQDVFERFVHTMPPIPYSLLGTRVSLSACLKASLSVHGRIQPTPQKLSLATNCKAAAQTAQARSPADAFAHLVSAKFAFDLNLPESGNTYLAVSHLIAPYEVWLARWRWEVAEPRFDILDERARNAYWDDVTLLAQSYIGAEDLARRYVSDEVFRARLDNILVHFNEHDQAQFFHFVRIAHGLGND